MKRFLPAIAATLLSLASAEVVWYYEDPSLFPSELYFSPTLEEAICAALLAGGGGGELFVNLSLPDYCPPAPPVVLWGKDAEGNTTYAIKLEVVFWGKRRFNNRRTGINALISVLKDNYNFRLNASGDTAKVLAQYLPPLIGELTTTPPSGASWANWSSVQEIALGDPKVENKENLRGDICRRIVGRRRCWRATLSWLLPVRALLHGGEVGEYQILIEADEFVPQGGKVVPLAVDGELIPPEELQVLPLPY